MRFLQGVSSEALKGSVIQLFQKIYSKWPILAFDLTAIPIAWFMAFWLRDDMQWLPVRTVALQSSWPVVLLIAVQTSCYYIFKVYRGLWRFSSVGDIKRIIQAVACAMLAVIPVFYWASFLHAIPRSIILLYGISLVSILCGGRMLMRGYLSKNRALRNSIDQHRVLIIGAGCAGESLVRELIRSATYYPVGFIDDQPSKKGVEVHGVRILGTMRELAMLISKYQINLIFIAIPSAGSAVMRRIVKECEKTGVEFRTLPSFQALASGRIEVNALREVNIEDLLGRDQVTISWEKISQTLQQKRVLITGGGGSIGSELCRQVLLHKPSLLVILDSSEFNLYKIDMELQTYFPDIQRELALVCITDKCAVWELFNKFRPQIVFHAAAYKHVPLLEEQIRVAVKNNIIGTQIIAETSVTMGVEKFVLISTDKAVNPTNIMGATKRVAEIFCQNLNTRVQTQFITVRFGNVLGSAGSVIPLFQKQLQAGGPITVTHPEIARYFMTVLEASQLILQAMVNGEGGEIFVLDMGEPIKIKYLAELMMRLAGKEVDIQYTGLRAGEKLFEELFHSSEELTLTAHEKLFQAKFRKIEWFALDESLRMLQAACANYQNDELLVILKSLVPEFLCSIEDAKIY